MKRNHWILFSVLFFVGFFIWVAPAVHAQKYPDHPIQLVIPYVAGATGDITARMLADELEKILGGKIIPVNRPGASAVLGTDQVVRSKKDGYTLLYAGASAMIYAPVSNPEIVHYDPFEDVEPLGFHYFFPQTVTVRSDAPWKTFPELVDYAKKNPGKLRVSTIGVGSTPHFILEMIMSITGTQFTHVPFEGGETVMTALLGGQNISQIFLYKCDVESQNYLLFNNSIDLGFVKNIFKTEAVELTTSGFFQLIFFNKP